MVSLLGAGPAAGEENLKRLPVADEDPGPNGDPSHEVTEAAPWWTGLVLCSAILAVSSAAAAFKYIEGAAPVTRAGWRLQVRTMSKCGLPTFRKPSMTE